MSTPESARSYFQTRLSFNAKRATLWSALWEHSLSRILKGSTAIIEIGAGWCDFINSAVVERRVAVDVWPGLTSAAAPGVETHVGSAEDLGFLADGTFDGAFASNLVEHLTHEQFDRMLEECARILRPDGRLVLIQPNYRLAYKRYFDDFTHVTVWSDVSLVDFLVSRGWEIELVRARYMPFSVKSRLPVSRLLVRFYLVSPFKPLAGQMLVVARPGRRGDA